MGNGVSIYQLIAIHLLQKLDNAGKLDEFYDVFTNGLPDETGKIVKVASRDFQRILEKELLYKIQMLDMEDGTKQEVSMVAQEMMRMIFLESLTIHAMQSIKGEDTK